MDDFRFDALARSLGTAGSRRRALGGLLAATLGTLGWHGGDESAAHDLKAKCKKKSGGAKKKCLKKAKKHAAAHLTALPLCTPTCAGKTCGSDGCGGVCGRCNGSCVNDSCICPSGSRLCDGRCQECCTDLHCAGGRTCQQGTCACPPGTSVCSFTGTCTECCSNLDCCGQLVCPANQQSCQTPGRTCGCPSGWEHLANGSCARSCVRDEFGFDNCPAACMPGGFGSCATSTEGTQHCIAHAGSCEAIPQVCTGTAECPRGFHCQVSGCRDVFGNFEKRCLPLCAS